MTENGDSQISYALKLLVFKYDCKIWDALSFCYSKFFRRTFVEIVTRKTSHCNRGVLQIRAPESLVDSVYSIFVNRQLRCSIAKVKRKLAQDQAKVYIYYLDAEHGLVVTCLTNFL